MAIPAMPKLATLPGNAAAALSPTQRTFVSSLAKTTGLDPTVAAAWVRNEEPKGLTNTDPQGHGAYNFLNIGIQGGGRNYANTNPAWTNPQQAGVTTGNWLAGRLALPGYGKSSSGIQGIARTAGMTPQQQISAIQHSGWAAGGETALPGLYSQFSGGALVALGAGQPAAAPAKTSPLAISPPNASGNASGLQSLSLAPLQSGLDLSAQQNQKALDALGKISGRSTLAAAAPNLAALTQQETPKTVAEKATKNVPLSAATPEGLTAEGEKAVELAKHYLGTKYVFGGASPKTGFDCSGLIQFTMAQLGIKIPRTAAEQAKAGKAVPLNALEPGDALSFSEDGVIGHTGMYIGGGQFIQAPHTGDVVKISPLAGHYASILVGARRFT